jgi:hypothetical protein
MGIKVWREGEAGEPSFPSDFNVVKKAVLQVTDIKDNNNKYYAIELHSGKNKFRIYTHYGRTDDLETNPQAGRRESRYCASQGEAEALYDSIYKEKTNPRKGYKPLNLASSKIGSSKSVGQSCGVVDDATLNKIKAKDGKKPVISKTTISSTVQEIVDYLYAEAVNALTTTVNVNITANGIETPLGVLTLGQIEIGQGILDEIADVLATKKKTSVGDKLRDLSGDFYTNVPHKIGRSRAAIDASIIDTAAEVVQKNDTLQLMRDMLNVNGDTNVLISPEIQKKYDALNCEIDALVSSSAEYKNIKTYVENSALDEDITVKNIWKICRPVEKTSFRKDVGNVKQLFHGSSVKNWVGILSRGLLLPKVVVTLGVSRTDAGWLGSGIYFGSEACTTVGYAHAGRRSTRFMAVADVALGKVKKYTKITYGLSKPPEGFHSCHGVSGSEFDDNEWVVYDNNQQQLQYLVEYTD